MLVCLQFNLTFAESRHARSAVSGNLELRAKGNVIEFANTNAIPAHGLAGIFPEGRSRIEEISLSSGRTKHFRLAARAIACVELPNWDGAKQRAISVRPKSIC